LNGWNDRNGSNRLGEFQRFERSAAIERLERWNKFLAKRLELLERVLVERLERFNGAKRLNGLNVWNQCLVNFYIRAITDLHYRKTPVIVWDVFECLPGLSERGKGWDYE